MTNEEYLILKYGLLINEIDLGTAKTMIARFKDVVDSLEGTGIIISVTEQHIGGVQGGSDASTSM